MNLRDEIVKNPCFVDFQGEVLMFQKLIDDAYQRASVVEDAESNNMENLPSIQLAEEMNQQQHKWVDEVCSDTVQFSSVC